MMSEAPLVNVLGMVAGAVWMSGALYFQLIREHRVHPAFVSALLEMAGLTLSDGPFRWAIHPGGRRIVEALAETFHLDDVDVAPSFDVLRRYGNMSSATLGFVLDAVGEIRQPTIALGFGPGLTMEGLVLVPGW